MRSLFYIVDRFKETSFEEWVENRITGDPLNTTKYMPEAADADDEEIGRHAVEAAIEASEARLAAVSEQELQDGYREFLNTCHDQDEINEEGYDHACLLPFFQGCCNIREVTIASRVHCERDLGALKTAYYKTMVRPTGDKSWSDAGADQVCALVRAMESSEVKLDSLTIAGISHTIFDRSTDRGELMSHALRVLVRPLRRLRLLIQAWSPEDGDLSEKSSDSESELDVEKALNSVPVVRLQSFNLFEKGPVREVLSEARELRALKLEPPEWDPHGEPEYIRLDYTLRDVQFPHLYELSLSRCAFDGDWLVDFLLQHKATLKRLSMSHMTLAEVRPSWRDIFTRLSCQLPYLYKAKVYGEFHRQYRPPILFDHKHSGQSMAYNQAMEGFILKGGNYPSEYSTEWRTREPEVDGNDEHPPHGSSGDNTLSDDPALDYESDEYDDWF